MKVPYKAVKLSAVVLYFAFVLASFPAGFEPGQQIGKNFLSFSLELLKILPSAFVLIGLFEVWVKKEKVEKHLGKGSGMLSHVWVILLAGTTVGGMYVAFPVSYALFRKGAKLSVIFTYLGASAICRIPMIIFEASFMGIKFSVIRLLVSIPLVVLSSIWLGHYLEKRHYQIVEGG